MISIKNAIQASLLVIFTFHAGSQTRAMPPDNTPAQMEQAPELTYSSQDLIAIFNDLKARSFAAIRESSGLIFRDMKSLGYASPFSLNLYIDIDRINRYRWPQEAVTGLLAHELAHIASYQRRSFVKRMLFVWNYYLSESKRRKIEHEADEIAIGEGYGNALVLTRTLAIRDYDEARVRKMRGVYYWPEDLERIISDRNQ
jgi:hypothetical protein